MGEVDQVVRWINEPNSFWPNFTNRIEKKLKLKNGILAEIFLKRDFGILWFFSLLTSQIDSQWRIKLDILNNIFLYSKNNSYEIADRFRNVLSDEVYTITFIGFTFR